LDLKNNATNFILTVFLKVWEILWRGQDPFTAPLRNYKFFPNPHYLPAWFSAGLSQCECECQCQFI